MRYIIDLPGNVIKEIRKILNDKDYNNINEFILTSIENQLALESSEIIDEDLFSSTMRIPKHPKIIEEKSEDIDYSFLLRVNKLNTIKVFSSPEISDLEFPKTPYANDWLWGQVNRIFPIKVALRILLKMQNENDNSVRLNDFLDYASETANKLGTKLNEIDKEMKRVRDKKMSTALPIGGTEKTLARYKNHFLIFQRTKDRILDGALARLKFANINVDGFVRLTKKGLEFAKMTNPIIDNDLYSNTTLSKTEKDFYINYIKENVIEELNPFKTILELISKGCTNVTSMNNEIQKVKPKWTETTIATQRAGALGRLFELGIVEKIKKGVKVDYKLTNYAHDYKIIGG